jgi:hypothetical protein
MKSTHLALAICLTCFIAFVAAVESPRKPKKSKDKIYVLPLVEEMATNPNPLQF